MDQPQAPEDVSSAVVTEHAGDALPLDLTFKDEQGRNVKLGQYFTGKKPVLLQLGYYGCPMLCGLVSKGLVDSLNQVSYDAGKDYEVVYVSIDPKEKSDLAAEKKQSYLSAYGRAGAAGGWHFLVGDQPQIEQLTKAAGFGYKWVPSAGQFAHPAVVILCTPDGRVSRYLYGVNYDPKTMRLSLVEASEGKIGTNFDRFLLTCFQYDGRQGKYAMTALKMMRVGGVVTLFLTAGLITFFFRHSRRARAAAAGGGEAGGQANGVTDAPAEDASREP